MTNRPGGTATRPIRRRPTSASNPCVPPLDPPWWCGNQPLTTGADRGSRRRPVPNQPPTSGSLPDSVRSELRDLQTETFEVEDIAELSADLMDICSSSTSTSSCSSCSTSSCCSCTSSSCSSTS
ncbi:thiazolylpeptide-type bacteriocin [Micromonospora sp. NPDC051296]